MRRSVVALSCGGAVDGVNAMQLAQIFISYRRDDAAGYARAVYDELARQFGADRVFIDVDDIDAGQAFDEVIQRAVGESKVLLVLIGKRWQGEREGLPPRISEPGDLVRQEVAAALARGMRVIPLLLDGATMPTEAQLPDVLRPLTRRNALEIGNTRFAADIARLVAALREALGEPAAAPAATPASGAPRATARRSAVRWWWLAGALLVVGTLAVLWLLRAPSRGDIAASSGRPDATATPAEPGAARPAIDGEWQAEVNYDWPNARYVERFTFAGEAGELHGSASFLGVRRGVLEGSTEPGGLRFVTRTGEAAGVGGSAETVHRYRGRLDGSEIRFVMQTEGGGASHVPVEFVARRVAQASSPVGR